MGSACTKCPFSLVLMYRFKELRTRRRAPRVRNYKMPALAPLQKASQRGSSLSELGGNGLVARAAIGRAGASNASGVK